MGKDAYFKAKRRWLRYEMFGSAYLTEEQRNQLHALLHAGQSRHRLAMAVVRTERKNRPSYFYGERGAQIQR
jgi:hypothetical protein